MSATVATKEAVFRVANELLESGQEPTVITITNLTGGSRSTVAKHFDEWKREHGPGAVKLPPETQRIVLQAGREIWSKLNELANDRVRAVQEAAEKAVKEAQEKLGFAEFDLKSAEAQRQSAIAVAQKTQSALEESQHKCNGLEAKLMALQAQCEELQRRVEDGMKTNAALIKEIGANRGSAIQDTAS